MIKKKKTKQNVGLLPSWGAPRDRWSGDWRKVDKNSLQTAGKAPADCGTAATGLRDGQTAVVAAIVVGVEAVLFRTDSMVKHFWFCLWPIRWETSRVPVLESSWGSIGPEGEFSAKIPHRLGMKTVTTLSTLLKHVMLMFANSIIQLYRPWIWPVKNIYYCETFLHKTFYFLSWYIYFKDPPWWKCCFLCF